MQKLKYLIILALGILLTLVYVQLDDYDSISNSLLDDNIKANQTIKELQETISELENKNEKLQEDIVFLYSKVENLNLEIEYMEHQATIKQYRLDNNITDINTTDLNATDFHTTFSSMETNISKEEPITLENENTITGFGTINE